MTCNSEFDCLLTWGETLLFDRFDLYVRRFTSSGWCPSKQRIGRKIGLPLEMTLALGDNHYLISAASSFKQATLQSFALGCDGCSCGGVTDDLILDSGYDSYGSAASGFHYEGASGNTAPRKELPNTPTWQIYSYDQEQKALRRNAKGEIDSRATFSDPDGQISIQAGNIDFDGDRFYVFYHKFFGVNHPQHPNTYSICYRFTHDQFSDAWSAETCPVENLPGLDAKGSKFTNMIQPVGSAWKGQISIIFQKDCHYDTCSLALLRND
jgi:hypothetical protein